MNGNSSVRAREGETAVAMAEKVTRKNEKTQFSSIKLNVYGVDVVLKLLLRCSFTSAKRKKE